MNTSNSGVLWVSKDIIASLLHKTTTLQPVWENIWRWKKIYENERKYMSFIFLKLPKKVKFDSISPNVEWLNFLLGHYRPEMMKLKSENDCKAG